MRFSRQPKQFVLREEIIKEFERYAGADESEVIEALVSDWLQTQRLHTSQRTFEREPRGTTQRIPLPSVLQDTKKNKT